MSSPAILAAQGAIISGVSWVLWRTLRGMFVKSDLGNLPGPEAASFFMGNFGQIFSADGWDFHKKLPEQYGKVIRMWGPFKSKHVYVFDPKALHHIVVKDQYIFEESRAFVTSNGITFGDGLLATLGDHHKKQRKMLNPVFSTAHLRHMVPMFTDVAKKLEAVIKNKVAKGPQEIDILHWMSRAALEMIGQSGLGHSFDPLIEGVPENPYCDAVKSFVPVLAPILFLRETMLPTLVKYTSPGFRRLLVDTVPWARIRRLRDIVDVMDETSVRIFEDKKEKLRMGDEELANQVSRAKDIMSILMKANMEAAEEDRLPEKEVLGQMSTFTFAGTDTTSNAISRTLHLLSNNLEIQERLRAEVTAARKEHGEEVPFDELMALPLLDAVCRETLRLFPPLPTLSREVRQDVVLPLSEPIKGLDGREMHEIFIPKDTTVFVSILNANRDPALWGPDSDVWNPDRWNAPLPKEISEARMPGIYSNMMTFLGGGRACIGFKFAQVEMKVMLTVLLSQFRFTPSLDKEIVWNMNGIVTPSVKNSKSLIESELPLNIEFVGNSA